MLTCRQLADFLDDYVLGTMDTRQREIVDQHLAVCPDCVNYLDSYRKTIAVSRAALLDSQDKPAPAGIPRDLINAAIASRPKPQ